MKRTLAFICLLILFFSSSCVSIQPNWGKITDFDKRITVTGFSILPPRTGDDWHIANKTATEISLAGKNEKTGGTLVAIGIVAQLPPDLKSDNDFLNFFKQLRESNSDPGRYEILKHDEIIEKKNNVTCINYHLVTYDKKAYTPAGYKKLILDIYGKTCRHPDDASYAVDISYSERYEEQNQPTDLEKRAMSFISTLSFEKFH